MENWCSDIDRGNAKYVDKKYCPSATLSVTIPIWNGVILNPGLGVEKK